MDTGVRTFTNTDDEEFEGMHWGVTYRFQPGETKALPERVAKHLAGQLGYKLAMKKSGDKPLGDATPVAEEALGEVTIPVKEEVKEEVVEEKVEEKEEEFKDLPKAPAKKKAPAKRGRPKKK